MLVKTDIPGYYKTPEGAVINTNDAEYQRILNDRRMAKERNAFEQRVEDLEADIKDIKNLLMQVLNGRNNGRS